MMLGRLGEVLWWFFGGIAALFGLVAVWCSLQADGGGGFFLYATSVLATLFYLLGRAIYGAPGQAGCSGPYGIRRVLIEETAQ